jgi:small-conductance mechanosensitive channel
MNVSLPTIMEFAVPVACIVISAAVGALLEFIVQRRVATSAFVRGHAWLAILIDALDAGILFWATALGVHIALAVSSLPPNVVRLLDQTLLVLVCVSVTIVAARFTGKAVLRLSRGPGQQIASGTLFATVSQALIVILGGLFTLSALGIEVTPLLTALGVGGLAVALALQPPLANLFSGIQLVASRQIRPGDFIALPGGQEGFVEDINWRSISIRMPNNSLVVVPNTVLATEVFTNYHLPEPRVAARVPLRVAYGSDLAFVERLALEAIAMVGDDMKYPAASRDAFVHVTEFGDTTVNLSVCFFVKRAIDQEQARSEFLRCFYDLMRRERIGSPIVNPVISQETVAKSAVTGKV